MTTSSADDEAPRALTAAEKRAARRARVLAGGERRLKLLTGEIGSLKPENEAANDEDANVDAAAVDKAMDEGVAELLDATEIPREDAPSNEGTPAETAGVTGVGGAKFPPRVDPAQRRRDAQARRLKKEAMVQEILAGSSSSATSAATATSAEDVDADVVSARGSGATPPAATAAVEKKAEPAFSRHSLALKLRSAEDKLVLLAIVGAALYLAIATDLRNVTTDLLLNNPMYLSYKQLVANGVPLESIRQQMQRENLEPALVDQIERVFVSQRKSDSAATSASLARSFLPSFPDVPGLFASWFSHPPIILCVLLLRVFVGLVGGALHSALKLPDVASPQDDDLGFVANLALASSPALKGYLAKARKSADDVVLFLWSLVLVVAARAVATAHGG